MFHFEEEGTWAELFAELSPAQSAEQTQGSSSSALAESTATQTPADTRKKLSKDEYRHFLLNLLSQHKQQHSLSEDVVELIDYLNIDNKAYLQQTFGEEAESFLHAGIRLSTHLIIFRHIIGHFVHHQLLHPVTEQKPSDTPQKNYRQEDPWTYAFRRGRYDYAMLLFPYRDAQRAQAQFERVDSDNENVLHQLARAGSEEFADMVTETLSHAQLQQFMLMRNRYGDTPLHLACAFNHPPLFVRMLTWLDAEGYLLLCTTASKPLLCHVAERGTAAMFSALLVCLDVHAQLAMFEAREQYKLFSCAANNTTHGSKMLQLIADFFTKHQEEMLHRATIQEAESTMRRR